MTDQTAVATRDEDQVPEIQHGSLTPMDMIDRALANGAGVEVMEKLMALQERFEANQGRKAFDHAIAQAKAEIPPIHKNREVDYTPSGKPRVNYRHEDLAGIARTVDPILTKHGLSYRYRSSQDGQTLTVTCILSHRDGYSEETSLSAPNDQSGSKNAQQGIGSAATYLQRYTLKLALGLAVAADDDGRGAGGNTTITADQWDTLRRLLDETGSNEDAFLKFYGAEALDTFPAAKFEEAKKKLEDKKAKAQGGGNG